MKQTPLTEQQLQEALEKLISKDEFSEFKDDLFNRLDNVVSQLETIRDEQTIAFHQHKELDNKVENHEERIHVLETSRS